MEKRAYNQDDFSVRLQTCYSSLRKSERKIADYLQQHSHQRLDVSITEFAKLLNVSEAPVSRFCRAVGFQGFQDLKLSLATSLSSTEEFKNIPIEIDETDSIAEVGKKLSNTLSGAIAETQRHLNMGAMNAAVEVLAQTNRHHFQIR
jgi:RpiR family carbohydrate utilization transcriptional regulator